MSRDSLDLIWRCADSPAVVPVLTGDDLSELSPREFGCLRALGLIRPGDTAGHVICRACAEDHIAEVTRVAYPDGAVRFFVMCPENGRVEIPRAHLLQWSVDFTPVLSSVLSVFGSPACPIKVMPGRAWNLGRVRLAGQFCAKAVCHGQMALQLRRLSRRVDHRSSCSWASGPGQDDG